MLRYFFLAKTYFIAMLTLQLTVMLKYSWKEKNYVYWREKNVLQIKDKYGKYVFNGIERTIELTDASDDGIKSLKNDEILPMLNLCSPRYLDFEEYVKNIKKD